MLIDFNAMSNEQLQKYDDMMFEVVLKIEDISSIIILLWKEVLKELDNRKLIRLVHGSYDDIGNAYIQRLWKKDES